MQSWDKMLADYDNGLADIERRMAELKAKCDTLKVNSQEWYQTMQRIIWLETMQCEMICDIQDIRDRQFAPRGTE